MPVNVGYIVIYYVVHHTVVAQTLVVLVFCLTSVAVFRKIFKIICIPEGRMSVGRLAESAELQDSKMDVFVG